MKNTKTRLRLRRHLRQSRRQVEDISQQAELQFERHFVRRLGRMWFVRRFIAAWTLLLVVLIGLVVGQLRALSPHYQSLEPVAGGTYVEGILGSFTNANPLYATGNVDRTVARLVFSGLFKFDDRNKLVGDLAEKFEVDGRGTTYTVQLREGLKWHDGHELTADDVVFTYKTIQNPDAKSPLAGSWANIKVAALDARTVTFELPNSLSAFPYSMTNGIVPKHLLEGRPLAELRSVSFNTASPVGAGPFKWDILEVTGTTPTEREQRIALVPYDEYHFGVPKLNRFVVRSFTNEQSLKDSFNRQELNGMVGLERTPEDLVKDLTVREHSFPLTSQVMVFFRMSNELLADVKVRQALVQAANQDEVINNIGFPVSAIRGPLLNSHVGYDGGLLQLTFNQAEAAKLLEEAGWKIGKNGIREKDGKPLSLRLYSQSTTEYSYVAEVLSRQWRAVGVDMQAFLQSDSDLQTTLTLHNYDALLYGISVGTDPDVFAYWHSSQAEQR